MIILRSLTTSLAVATSSPHTTPPQAKKTLYTDMVELSSAPAEVIFDRMVAWVVGSETISHTKTPISMPYVILIIATGL